MWDIQKYITIWLIGTLGAAGLFVAGALAFPKAAEAVARFLGSLFRGVPFLYKSVQRLLLKLFLQVRVNRHLRRRQKALGAPSRARRVTIKWVRGGDAARAFVTGNKAVIFLAGGAANDNENYVRTLLGFTSSSVATRVKYYLSQPQKVALDLFVTASFLRGAKDDLSDIFVGEYLIPETADDSDPRIARYFSAFETLDRAGLFFEFFLYELEYLGNKVFGRPRMKEFSDEVDAVLDVGVRVALRQPRERVHMSFNGEYARCAVTIVGSPEKITEAGDIWVAYIRERLIPRGFESLYLLGLRC